MIVRDEVHVVAELLDSIWPYINSWVIVDTGSTDGTQGFIQAHMARLGICGKIYERPWMDFAHNRTEALALAQGHSDYIWMIDADDIVVGAPEFNELDADVYYVKMKQGSWVYRFPQIFRNGLDVSYRGVVHEVPVWDSKAIVGELPGDWFVASRRLGTRSKDPEKYARDAALLLVEVERDPGDVRSVFYLAQSFFDAGDFGAALQWYERRIELGGWDQEVYYSLVRVAESMVALGRSWGEVQDAYLRAWEFRPSRAEALCAVAQRYRVERRWELGFVFARRAAEIPFPVGDTLFVNSEVYSWRALDELAICASWVGEHGVAFESCRRLIASADLPDGHRGRVAVNRDFSVPAMVQAALVEPGEVKKRLVAGGGESDVVVCVVAGSDVEAVVQTIDSFVNCCTDVWRVGRFVVVGGGLSEGDRVLLGARYGFVGFAGAGEGEEKKKKGKKVASGVGGWGRYCLQVGAGWRFFAPEDYVSRLISVFEAEPDVVQVGVNFEDAQQLTGRVAAEAVVRRAAGAGRYVLGDGVINGPAMIDIARLPSLAGGGVDALGVRLERAVTAGAKTATLDETLTTINEETSSNKQTRTEAEIRKKYGDKVCFVKAQSGQRDSPTALDLARSPVLDLVACSRLTAVVDIGANPIDGEPPYRSMLHAELCSVTGFEPQPSALADLQRRRGPHETYLPYAVGDGSTHRLHIARASGMTSLFPPDPRRLALFNGFTEWGEVVDEFDVITHRLDDISEVAYVDLLKIDIQGGELMTFTNAQQKLADAVAIHTEVSFVPLYRGQPVFGDVDLELRRQGFLPHSFAAIKRWAIAPMVFDGNFRSGGNQLLEADVVYIRDIGRPELITDTQLSHLAMLAFHVYRSIDLALYCILELERRGSSRSGAGELFLSRVGTSSSVNSD